MFWFILIAVLLYLGYEARKQDDAVIDIQSKREWNYHSQLLYNKDWNRLTKEEKEKVREMRYDY